MAELRPATPGALTTPVRVGVDVTAIAEVAEAVAGFGERYLHRLFTPHEIASCQGAPASLAARFAAKEAVVKVLEPSGARPAWRDIEIVRRPDGACRIHLHGRAASLAAERGVGLMSVSLSHEAGLAVAVVAATCTGSATPAVTAATAAQFTQQTDIGGAQR